MGPCAFCHLLNEDADSPGADDQSNHDQHDSPEILPSDDGHDAETRRTTARIHRPNAIELHLFVADEKTSEVRALR